MDPVENYPEFIAIDERVYDEERGKPGGDPAIGVLGIIRAQDEMLAADTATSIFQEKMIIIRKLADAEPDLVNAAHKMGYLNTSQPRNYGDR